MNTFADYILEEEKLDSKMEIVYYLSKKAKINYNSSVIFKTEILRMFLKYSKINVDLNDILTASLLCNCKKIDNAQNIEKIHAYAKEGADYLQGLGFGKRFCKICEQINRYSNSAPREKESDILELIDQFGGMLLDRPERIGFKPDEALVLLEYRNLKDIDNQYLQTFKEFISFVEKIQMNDITKMTVLERLVKIHNETKGLTDFIKKVVYEYEPKIDKLMDKYMENMSGGLFCDLNNPNRPLFSKETTKKIMSHLNEKNIIESE